MGANPGCVVANIEQMVGFLLNDDRPLNEKWWFITNLSKKWCLEHNMYISPYIYICIYIYREREREICT